MTRHYDLSEKDDWISPPELVDDIDGAVNGITLDPCAHEQTSYGEMNYRLEDGQDGLQKDWVGDVFVNPPFSYKKEWLQKVVEELQSGHVDTVTVITPDGTDTKSWWHEYIAAHAQYICFLEGRLSYLAPLDDDDDPEEVELVTHPDLAEPMKQMNNPTFGTAVSVYCRNHRGYEKTTEIAKALTEWGHVVVTHEA